MFFSEKLKKFGNLKHCFFSRRNGVSKGYYESLNCGLGSEDQKEYVSKNLELVAKKIKKIRKYKTLFFLQKKWFFKRILRKFKLWFRIR